MTHPPGLRVLTAKDAVAVSGPYTGAHGLALRQRRQPGATAPARHA
jgi:hypothetical protein